MSDLDILRDLLKGEALATTENQYGKKVVILKEPRSQPEYFIEICNAPNDIIAIKVDEFPASNKIFKNSKGECKRADFVILAHTSAAKWIIYLEMKSGNNSSNPEIVQQLKGAECFVAYCRALGQIFWRQPKFLEEQNYLRRFISVKNISMNKQPTWLLLQSEPHDSPEKMLRISAPSRNRLDFNKMVGRPRRY